ncbi:MAG: hypothetical protein JXA44_11165 [Methanospirillaceae archaeon]|nr:hypothetical protein [Methanospirillaceae archaeon]
MNVSRTLLLMCGLVIIGLAGTCPATAEPDLPVCHLLSHDFIIMLPSGWVTFPMQGYEGLTGIADPFRDNITYMLKIMDNPTGTTLDAPLLHAYLDAVVFRDDIEVTPDSLVFSENATLSSNGMRNDRYVSIFLGSTPTGSYELYGYYDDEGSQVQDRELFLAMAETISQNVS